MSAPGECNHLIREAYDKGYRAGYKQGHKEGYQMGELERSALAIANSDLRSELLAHEREPWN